MAEVNKKVDNSEYDRIEKEYFEQEKKKKFRAERDKKIDERLDALEKQNKAIIEFLQETKEMLLNSQKPKETKEKNSFHEELRLTSMLRKQEENRIAESMEYKANMIISSFQLWCLVNNPIMDANNKEIDMQRMVKECFRNDKLFKTFCEQEKSAFGDDGFWVKKYIAEKFFNYEYTFNSQTLKWSARKSKL